MIFLARGMIAALFVVLPGAALAQPSPTVAELLKQGEAEVLDGRLGDAVATGERAVDLARTSGDPESLGDALEFLCNAGAVIFADKAIEPCQAAYDHRLATLGKDHFKTYTSQAALANIYLTQDPDKAIVLAKEAASNMTRLMVTPTQKSDAGTAWGMLALGYKVKGAYLDAIPAFETSLELLSAADADPVVFRASVLTDYADLLITMGDYETAQRMAADAVEVRSRLQGAGHPELADTLGVLGDAQRRMGRYDDAETQFRRALAIAEESKPQVPIILGRQYQNLGLVYLHTGRLAEARIMLEKAAEVFSPLGRTGYQLLSSVYNDLANVLFAEGRIRDAIDAENKAIETHLTYGDRKADRNQSFMTVLANLKYKADETDEARALIDEVIETRLTATPNSSRTADALMLRGFMRLEQGDLQGALGDLEKAQQIVGPLNPNSSLAIRVNWLLARGYLEQATGEDTDKAYDLALRAARSQAYVISNMTRVQSASGGLQTPADRRNVFDTVLDAAWRKAHAGG